MSGPPIVTLLGAEQRRFWARDAIRWLVVIALFVVTLVNVIQIARSTNSGAGAMQSGFVDNVPTECVVGTLQGRPVLNAACTRERVGLFGSAPGGGPPGTTSVFFSGGRDRRMNIAAHYRETIAGTGIALVLLAFILGSTYLAAEFNALGLSTQLLFEPRRWRLLLTKALSAAIGSATAALAVLAWIGIGQFAGSAWRGVTVGIDASWWWHRFGDLARVSLAVALAAVLSLCIAAITRRTVVAIVGFFGLMIAVQFLANVSWGKPIARLSPITALWAMAYDKFTDDRAFAGITSLSRAVTTSLVWTAILLAVAGWRFSVKEIR